MLTKILLSPDAAPGTGSAAAPSTGSPASQAPVSHDGANETGPDFTAYAPEVSAPAASGPVTGQPAASEQPAATTEAGKAAAAEVDPDAAELAYLQELAGVEPEKADAKPEAVTQSKAFDKFASLDPNAILAAAQAAGVDLTAEDVKEIQNASKLVGRLGQEKGDLLKDKQAFTAAMEPLGRLIQKDAQGRPVSFDVPGLLQFAESTPDGVAKIHKALAERGMELVPIGTRDRLQALPEADPTDGVAAEVAKSFKLDVEGLPADDILAIVTSNPRANAAFTRKMTALESQKAQAGQQQQAKTQQQQQAEQVALNNAINALAQKMGPDKFKAIEPVIMELGPVYAEAQTNPTTRLNLLHLAAIGKSVGKTVPGMLKKAEQRGYDRAMKSLGLSAADIQNPPAGAQQAGQGRKFNAESMEEEGPDLIGVGARNAFATTS